MDASLGNYKSQYIGFDLWQVKSGTIFDNIIITDSFEEAKAFAEETYSSLVELERKAKDAFDAEESKRVEDSEPEANMEAEEASDEEKKVEDTEEEHSEL